MIVRSSFRNRKVWRSRWRNKRSGRFVKGGKSKKSLFSKKRKVRSTKKSRKVKRKRTSWKTWTSPAFSSKWQAHVLGRSSVRNGHTAVGRHIQAVVGLRGELFPATPSGAHQVARAEAAAAGPRSPYQLRSRSASELTELGAPAPPSPGIAGYARDALAHGIERIRDPAAALIRNYGEELGMRVYDYLLDNGIALLTGGGAAAATYALAPRVRVDL